MLSYCWWPFAWSRGFDCIIFVLTRAWSTELRAIFLSRLTWPADLLRAIAGLVFSWPSDLHVIVGLDLLDQLTSEPLLASFYITCWPPSLCRSRFTWPVDLHGIVGLVLPEQLASVPLMFSFYLSSCSISFGLARLFQSPWPRAPNEPSPQVITIPLSL